MSTKPALRSVPKSAPRRRYRASVPARQLGLVDQIRLAARRENRLAAVLGAAFGAWIPLACYHVAHNELAAAGAAWRTTVLVVLVAGALLYSAQTVWEWARLAFDSRAKALGFTVLTEGVMTFAMTEWLSLIALGYLMFINAVASGVTIATGKPKRPPAYDPTN